MTNIIKQVVQSPKTQDILKSTPFYNVFKTIRLWDWHRKGRPIPPPNVVKQNVVKQYAKSYSCQTFVETGTYLGDMIRAVHTLFPKVISIELDPKLHSRAVKKFRRFPNVTILHGDSSKVLEAILPNTIPPVLFWLDAHDSGGITARGDLETPIVNELKILSNYITNNCVILIDDARNFIGQNDYLLLDQIQIWASEFHPDWNFEVKDDIIRISPQKQVLGDFIEA
jgi:hypothetical protein